MERLLDDAKRMVLAWPGLDGPRLAPMAFWWDGRHLWLSTAASAWKVKAFDADPACVVWVPPTAEGRPGIHLRGRARVFHPGDLVAMATHGAVVAAAQTALAVKNSASLVGYVADASRIPARWMPTRRVMIRIAVDDRFAVEPPAVGPGIAPALPTVVPPEVRRLLAGERRVALATSTDGGLGLLPAVWGAGWAVDLPVGAHIPDGTSVAAVVDHDPGFRPTETAGLSVRGTWRAGRIAPDSVRWWHGFDQGTAGVQAGPVDPIVIPD